jgi:hypothetical protein
MLVGKPVRRIYEVVDLILGVRLAAARDVLRADSFIYHRLNLVPYGKRPGNIREMPWLRGLSADPQSGNEREH